MARTKNWQTHPRKKQSVAKCMALKIDYAIDPDKTDGGRLVSSYACDPDFAAAEFAVTKRLYRQRTGFDQDKGVAVYLVMQAFFRGEITPEEANRVGYELAMRLTNGEFAFIVGTHTDRQHIHNHIVWNSTSLDGTKKYFEYLRSDRDVRRISDQLCRENGLSVIEDPGKRNAVETGKRTPIRRDMIRSAIDEAMRAGPKDFEELTGILRKAGLKVRTGEHTDVRLPGEKEYVRLKTLGEGYTEEDLRAALEGSPVHSLIPAADGSGRPNRIPLFSELDEKIGQGRGQTYERVMKVLWLKHMAETLVYMEERGFDSLEQLSAACSDMVKRGADMGKKIKKLESEIAEKREMRRHAANYRETAAAWKEYRRSGWSDEYLAGHETEIILHRASGRYFSELGIKKLPAVNKLDEEISRLEREKSSAYKEYKELQKESRELEKHRANAEYIMDLLNRNDREVVLEHE